MGNHNSNDPKFVYSTRDEILSINQVISFPSSSCGHDVSLALFLPPCRRWNHESENYRAGGEKASGSGEQWSCGRGGQPVRDRKSKPKQEKVPVKRAIWGNGDKKRKAASDVVSSGEEEDNDVQLIDSKKLAEIKT